MTAETAGFIHSALYSGGFAGGEATDHQEEYNAMAMKIIMDECLKCGACVMVCPRECISEETDDGGDVIYLIEEAKCTECEDEGGPQCREECPVPECIVKVE